ncbi:hypothetical protein BC829DRAFT_439977 [Chytridium lagenaria]|nr:hypothetical protein BC829DRAFT_439977 [Chytridium lagenaria]
MSSKRQCLTLLSVLLLLPLVTPQTYHGCIPEGAAYNGDDFSCFCATTSSLIAYIKANPGSTSGVSCPLRCGNGEECGKSNDQIGALLGKQGSWSVYIDAATPSVPSPPPPPSPSAVNSLSPPPSPPSQPENPVNNNLAPADTSTPKQAESTPSSNPSDNPSDNPIEPSPASPSTTFSPRPFLPNAGAPAVAATMTRDTSLPATSQPNPPAPNTGTVALSLVSVIIVVAVVTGLFVRYRRRETERKEEGGELGKLSANAKLRMLMIQPLRRVWETSCDNHLYASPSHNILLSTPPSSPQPPPSPSTNAKTLSNSTYHSTTSQEDHKPRRRAPSSIYMEAVAETSPLPLKPEEPQTFTPLGRAPTVLMEEESKPRSFQIRGASTVHVDWGVDVIDHGSSLYGSSIMDGASVMSRPHSSDVMTGSVIMEGGWGD